MERLDFVADKYSSLEASIHMTRYMSTRPYVAGKRVLDAACGEGYGSALMKQWGAKSVVGVDVSEEAIQAADSLFRQDGLSYMVHDAEHLPFEDVSFDMAVSFETVEHLDHPEQFLSELRRVVKAGGTIIVSCPNDNYYAENIPDFSNPYHKKRYSFFEFREMAERILGKTDHWYLGSTVAGFYNLPIEKQTDPQLGMAEAPDSMLGMMDGDQLSDVCSVPQDHYVNHWNCVYYLGVWGGEKTINEACVYPVPHFFLYQNTAVPESMKLARSWQSSSRALEEELAALEERYRVLTNERDRLCLMNDMQQKEQLILWDQVRLLRSEKEQLFEEHLKYFGLLEAYEKLSEEHLKYFGLLEAYEKQSAWIEETQKSLSWRLVTKLKKVSSVFRKK